MYARSARYYDAIYSFKDYAVEADAVSSRIRAAQAGRRHAARRRVRHRGAPRALRAEVPGRGHRPLRGAAGRRPDADARRRAAPGRHDDVRPGQDVRRSHVHVQLDRVRRLAGRARCGHRAHGGPSGAGRRAGRRAVAAAGRLPGRASEHPVRGRAGHRRRPHVDLPQGGTPLLVRHGAPGRLRGRRRALRRAPRARAVHRRGAARRVRAGRAERRARSGRPDGPRPLRRRRSS